MSKRFGRNQRRRAREALAAAESEAEQTAHSLRMAELRFSGAQSELRQLRAKVSVYERQMTACRKVLGESIALPPVDRLVDSTLFRQLVEQGERVPRMVTYDDVRPLSMRDVSTLESMVCTFESDTIEAIEGGIEFDSGSALRRQMHAYLTTQQGAILYRVNLDSLAQIDRPEAVARISDMLAREFIDTLKRHGPRNRR